MAASHHEIETIGIDQSVELDGSEPCQFHFDDEALARGRALILVVLLALLAGEEADGNYMLFYQMAVNMFLKEKHYSQFRSWTLFFSILPSIQHFQ